jgi:hypothetical protein
MTASGESDAKGLYWRPSFKILFGESGVDDVRHADLSFHGRKILIIERAPDERMAVDCGVFTASSFGAHLELVSESLTISFDFASVDQAGLFEMAFDAAKNDRMFVRAEFHDEVELEEALEAHSFPAIFGAIRKTSAYSRGDMKAVVYAILSESFAVPSRAGVLGDVLRELLSEHPEAAEFLPSAPSCAGHLLLLGALAGNAAPPASRLLASFATDDEALLASEVYSKAPPDFDAKVSMSVANGDVLLSAPASRGTTRQESLLSIAARFGACRCVRFLLSNGSKVGQSEVESALFGGNSEIIRELLDRLPVSDDLALLEAALEGRRSSVARWLLQDHAVG